MDWVGHKDSKTTLEIYQQITKDIRKNQEEDLKKISLKALAESVSFEQFV